MRFWAKIKDKWLSQIASGMVSELLVFHFSSIVRSFGPLIKAAKAKMHGSVVMPRRKTRQFWG